MSDYDILANKSVTFGQLYRFAYSTLLTLDRKLGHGLIERSVYIGRVAALEEAVQRRDAELARQLSTPRNDAASRSGRTPSCPAGARDGGAEDGGDRSSAPPASRPRGRRGETS